MNPLLAVGGVLFGWLLLTSGSKSSSSNSNSGSGQRGTTDNSGGGNTPTVQSPKQYTVQAGDTMISVAQKLTGDGNRYQELFAANPKEPTTYMYSKQFDPVDGPPDPPTYVYNSAYNPGCVVTNNSDGSTWKTCFMSKVLINWKPGYVINLPSNW